MKLVHAALLSLAWISAADAQNSPPPPASTSAQSAGAAPATPMSRGEMHDLIEAARATAQATREGVDYGRVVPDILQQILAKLDKIEIKLDRIESNRSPSRKGR